MDERRAAIRKRVMYGAVATISSSDQSYDCIVKNLSDLGARVEFDRHTELADDVELSIAQTGVSYRARIVWKNENTVGLAFTSAPSGTYAPREGIDEDLRDTQMKARLLLRRVNELMGDV